jgi:hypothetical protein
MCTMGMDREDLQLNGHGEDAGHDNEDTRVLPAKSRSLAEGFPDLVSRTSTRLAPLSGLCTINFMTSARKVCHPKRERILRNDR